MPKVWLRINSENEKGFSIVELLLAVAVFGFMVTGLVGAIVYGRASTAGAGDQARAVFLAEEGIEATRNIAAASYTNLIDGTYGLAQTGNQWALTGSSDTSGIYTRQIIVDTAATNRKTITSTVSWPKTGGTTGRVTLTSRLANWVSPIKQWSNAVLAGSTDVTGTADAVKTYNRGTYAYTVTNATTNNFVITNVTNPAAPVNVSTTTIAGTPTNVYVSGNYAYVTNTSDTAELQVIDIAVPTAPVLKTSVNMLGAGNGQSVYVSGNFAYVVRAADAVANAFELTIVNISAPLIPVVAGGYNSTLSFNDVYVSGTNAFVATSSTATEMLVLGVATPATPTLVASYNAPTTTTALAISGFGNTILLGTGTTLNQVNVTVPAAPASLGSFTAAGIISDVDEDITNKFAFLRTAATAAEFQVVNIAVPASMTLAKTVDIVGTISAAGGVNYNASFDFVVGASASDTQEIVVLVRS